MTGAGPAATAALCLLDLWVGVRVLGGAMGPETGLALHYGAVVAFGALLLARGLPDRTDSLAWIALAALFGPVSGVALACLALFARVAPPVRPATAGVAIPPETSARVLADRVRAGRRHSLSGALPRPFAEIFASGDLDLQQRAMSSMSRDWRPEMRPALHRALDSDIPAIRVQAAAIHAKLRGRHEGALRDLSADGTVWDAAAARRAVDIARSGFVPPEAAAALLRKADAIGTISSPGPVHPPSEGPRRIVAPPRLKRHACGGVG